MDLDSRVDRLEHEWRLAYEAGESARAEFERSPAACSDQLERVRARIDAAELRKAVIMAEIEVLEHSLSAN